MASWPPFNQQSVCAIRLVHSSTPFPAHPSAACWWGPLGMPAVGLAVWMPWPSTLLSGNPLVPTIHFYSLLRFQFQRRPMIAGVPCLQFYCNDVPSKYRKLGGKIITQQSQNCCVNFIFSPLSFFIKFFLFISTPLVFDFYST